MNATRQRRLIRDLERIYARLPKIKCQRKCQSYCGPIGMSEAERARIEAETGPLRPFAMGTLSCPYLGGGGECEIYDQRPLICRIWGMVEQLPCEWGCQPEWLLTEREVAQMMRELDRLKEGPQYFMAPEGWQEAFLLAKVLQAAGEQPGPELSAKIARLLEEGVRLTIED